MFIQNRFLKTILNEHNNYGMADDYFKTSFQLKPCLFLASNDAMLTQILSIYKTSINRCIYLLFISYKFVKGFLAMTFLLLTSSWNFHDVCQRFLYNQERNFSWIRQKLRNFPIDPHSKNRHFCNVMSIDMTLQKWAIFIMGVYEEILCLS